MSALVNQAGPITNDPAATNESVQSLLNAVPELAISHWWRFANLNSPLVASDGQPVSVVFRGIWSHGMGPDFPEAMIALENGVLSSGSIEIHRRSSDWYAHGHHLDPSYNSVILHVVLVHDREPTLNADGARVPVVELPAGTVVGAGAPATAWSLVGGDVCASSLVASHRDELRSAVHDLGDLRLGGKGARLEARLASREPGQVLYSEIMDGLGYSANREAMVTLAGLAPLQTLEQLAAQVESRERGRVISAALLGVAGFLPLSPLIQEIAGLSHDDVISVESFWQTRCSAWHHYQLPPTHWNFSRVRPANHPARRIVAAAMIVAHAKGGLLFNLVEAVRNAASVDDLISDWAVWNGQRLLGSGRSRAIAANAVIPFMMAFAAHSEDDDLSHSTSQAWETLPGEDPNQITRRAARQIAGKASLGPWGARGMQGLIQLDTTLCAPRRCFECPIAHLVVEADSTAINPADHGCDTSGEVPQTC